MDDKSGNPPVEHVSAPRNTGYHTPSSSMEPTLHCAMPTSGCVARYPDRPLVEPLDSEPGRGDIVVFKWPPRAVRDCGAFGTGIGRVVGLPRERWDERDGFIYINGRRLAEPYIQPLRRDEQSMPEQAIPSDHYLLLGDNRSQSCDSRRWGPLPRERIVGKVVKIYRQG